MTVHVGDDGVQYEVDIVRDVLIIVVVKIIVDDKVLKKRWVKGHRCGVV